VASPTLPGFLPDPNAELRAARGDRRALSVYCYTTRRPRLVALVVERDGRDVLLLPAAAIGFPTLGGMVQVGCRCPQRGHTIAVGTLAEALSRLRRRPAKARIIDVARVSRATVAAIE
jgi:hypothetical protein